MSAETSPGRPEISEHAVQEPFSVEEPQLLETQANEDLVVSSMEVGNADEASPTLDASLNANKLALTIMESEGHSPPIIDDNGDEKQEDSLKPEDQEAGGNQSLVDPTNKSLTEATEDSTVGMVEVEQPGKKSGNEKSLLQNHVIGLLKKSHDAKRSTVGTVEEAVCKLSDKMLVIIKSFAPYYKIVLTEEGVSLEEKDEESPETGAMLRHDEKTGELSSPTPEDTSEIESVSLEEKAEEITETDEMPHQYEVSLSATEETGERASPIPDLLTKKNEECCEENVEGPPQAGKPVILKEDETSSLSTIEDTSEVEYVVVEETVEEFLELAPLLQEIINNVERALLKEKAEETPETGAMQQQDEVSLSATEKTGEASFPTPELPTIEIKHEERFGEKDEEAPQAGKPAILQQDEEISGIDLCSSLMKRLQLTDNDSP